MRISGTFFLTKFTDSNHRGSFLDAFADKVHHRDDPEKVIITVTDQAFVASVPDHPFKRLLNGAIA